MEDGKSPRRKFSLLWVAAWSQAGTLGFAVWFVCYSLRLSCAESEGFAQGIFWAHSLNCCLLAVAAGVERRWDCWAYPVFSWLGVLIALGIAAH